MNWASLMMARVLGRESVFARESLPQSELLNDVAGKTVAIIGNARSLEAADHGKAIDGADIVVRINSAPIPDPRSHGSRTDWLAISIPVPDSTIQDRKPKRILWMTRKRKRLPLWLINDPRFFLNAKTNGERLGEMIGSPPTTGLLVIDLLSQSQAKTVTLYGFDFFTSKSLSGNRSAAQVPHDFNAEKSFVMDLISRSDQFRMVTTQSPT